MLLFSASSFFVLVNQWNNPDFFNAWLILSKEDNYYVTNIINFTVNLVAKISLNSFEVVPSYAQHTVYNIIDKFTPVSGNISI